MALDLAMATHHKDLALLMEEGEEEGTMTGLPGVEEEITVGEEGVGETMGVVVPVVVAVAVAVVAALVAVQDMRNLRSQIQVGARFLLMTLHTCTSSCDVQVY